MKEKESQVPLICAGTVCDLSGHRAVVTRILKEGVEVTIKDQTYILDFDKVALAASQQMHPEA